MCILGNFKNLPSIIDSDLWPWDVSTTSLAWNLLDTLSVDNCFQLSGFIPHITSHRRLSLLSFPYSLIVLYNFFGHNSIFTRFHYTFLSLFIFFFLLFYFSPSLDCKPCENKEPSFPPYPSLLVHTVYTAGSRKSVNVLNEEVTRRGNISL